MIMVSALFIFQILFMTLKEDTDIHRDYVAIMEQIIEAKLKENFTEEDIQEFYKTFRENLDKYEKIDGETIDVLFGFIDFEKFKEKLITYKKGI